MKRKYVMLYILVAHSLKTLKQIVVQLPFQAAERRCILGNRLGARHRGKDYWLLNVSHLAVQSSGRSANASLLSLVV